jgi:hypothetical protein
MTVVAASGQSSASAIASHEPQMPDCPASLITTGGLLDVGSTIELPPEERGAVLHLAVERALAFVLVEEVADTPRDVSG